MRILPVFGFWICYQDRINKYVYSLHSSHKVIRIHSFIHSSSGRIVYSEQRTMVIPKTYYFLQIEIFFLRVQCTKHKLGLLHTVHYVIENTDN